MGLYQNAGTATYFCFLAGICPMPAFLPCKNGEKLTPWSGCANDQPCLPEGQSIEMFKKLPFPIPVESSTYRNPGKSFVFDTSAEPQISLLRFFFRKRYLWSSTDIVLEVFFLKTISLISRWYRFWRLFPENDIVAFLAGDFIPNRELLPPWDNFQRWIYPKSLKMLHLG